ncbi:MAG: RNA polymerase sigma factor [Planctomycetota bacterium]|jgi:RNA polymerase sigma-70 factor (ECF subfamily)
MLEDRLLLRRFKNGSSEALCRIYEKYEDYLLTIAAALVGDVNAAEDVVHDVFCSFIESRERIRLSGNLKSFLRTCVANRARDKMRSAKMRAVGLDGTESIAADMKPDQSAVLDEQSRKLTAALAQLPYDQREAIVLHLRGGMKFRRIAAARAVSINTIKSRYRYGLEKLRSILNSEVNKNEISR